MLLFNLKTMYQFNQRQRILRPYRAYLIIFIGLRLSLALSQHPELMGTRFMKGLRLIHDFLH
jgi:hypothetical protein